MRTHAERSHSFVVALPPEEALPFFTPEGERRWAEGWEPEYFHPADGRPERGMVFTTAHGGEHTIWTMTRHEPQAGLVEYARVTPGSRAGLVRVQCEAEGPARTRVTVSYKMTALAEAGDEALAAMDEARYRESIESWGRAIAAVIATAPSAAPPSSGRAPGGLPRAASD